MAAWLGSYSRSPRYFQELGNSAYTSIHLTSKITSSWTHSDCRRCALGLSAYHSLFWEQILSFKYHFPNCHAIITCTSCVERPQMFLGKVSDMFDHLPATGCSASDAARHATIIFCRSDGAHPGPTNGAALIPVFHLLPSYLRLTQAAHRKYVLRGAVSSARPASCHATGSHVHHGGVCEAASPNRTRSASTSLSSRT